MLQKQKIHFFPWIAVLGFMLTASFGLSAQKKDAPPNFVIFIADDVGWNDLGATGNPVVKTPNIDRISSQGLRFTHAYLTTSSCSPSRCSILSGRYPHNTGAAELHTSLPEEVALFTRPLRRAGYYCASAGKWHLGEAAKKDFDLVVDRDNGIGGEDNWVEVLQERPNDQPFFLWLAAVDAHRAWGENRFNGTNDPNLIAPPPYLVNTPETRQDLANYYDEITRFDYYIGLVEAELERQGVLDNTLILIMADNGRPFPRCKTRLLDDGIRTPFIVKWPHGIKKQGSVAESLISVVDIAPTLLELAGVPATPNFQGYSFTSLLKKPGKPFRNYVFGEHNWHDYEAHERSVRTKDYLYIFNARPQFPLPGPADSNRSPAYEDLKRQRDQSKLTAVQTDIFAAPRPMEELYYLPDDPQQLVNVASLPQHQGALRQLRTILQQWQRETDDSTPDHLTPANFDLETGEKLPETLQRGVMPGSDKNAVFNANKGPF